MTETRIVLVFWEPRWHGLARWDLLDETEGSVELAHGWWRPPPGWRWQQVVVRDYDGTPLQWLPFMGRHVLTRVDAELQVDAS